MVSEKQIKLAELKRAQEELERERATLEEMRRRQAEFHAGREEMLRHLTRGIGLLDEAELNARRDAEQMARTLAEFREAAEKVQVLSEQNWTPDTYNVELTRGLTTIENARMEWNSARLKFPILTAAPAAEPDFRARQIGFAVWNADGFAPALQSRPRADVAAGAAGRRVFFWRCCCDAETSGRMGLFNKKVDPITERSRELTAKIADLESRIKRLDEAQETNGRPRLRSTAYPQGFNGSPRKSPGMRHNGEPVFEAVDQNQLKDTAGAVDDTRGTSTNSARQSTTL